MNTKQAREAVEWLVAPETQEDASQTLLAATAVCEAAPLLVAALGVVQAALDWTDDTGECHFCGGGPGKHDEECPVRSVEEALL